MNSYPPIFPAGDAHAQLAFDEYSRRNGDSNRKEFLQRASEMHHFLKESYIYGMGCRLTAWAQWRKALSSRLGYDPMTRKRDAALRREMRRIFLSVDHSAPYS